MELQKPEEIKIRSFNDKDLRVYKKIITDLLHDNLRINFPALLSLYPSAQAAYDDMVRYEKDASAILVGAFFEETLLGLLWAYRREFLGEKRIHLSHIIIQENVRDLGIGSLLLQHLESLAEKDGIYRIELMTSLDNAKTLEFYQARGYQSVRVQLEKELKPGNDH